MENAPKQHGSAGWTIAQLHFEDIAKERVRSDRTLFYLLAAASFVEITSDLYARNLIAYFGSDPSLQAWLTQRWEPEELKHGRALRSYVEAVWPEFDWERTYRDFLADYSRFCSVDCLEPTPALELAARCVVETGTAGFYATLARVAPEPVLRRLATLIKTDEIRHFGRFYHDFLKQAQREGIGRIPVLRTLVARVAEVDQEDAYYAFKHVLGAGQSTFTPAAYRSLRRHYMARARQHYPYRMTVKMFLKPLRLSAPLRRAATPLLSAGVRFLARP